MNRIEKDTYNAEDSAASTDTDTGVPPIEKKKELTNVYENAIHNDMSSIDATGFYLI